MGKDIDMVSLKLKAADVLSPLLSTLREFHGSPLLDVREHTQHGNVTSLHLVFANHSLVVTVVEDDDTLEVTSSATGPNSSSTSSQAWKNALTKELAWSWVMFDQHGYLDGVLLSFGKLVPEFIITAVASSIQVKHVI